MGIDFTTETERKRCRQFDKCEQIIDNIRNSLYSGRDSSCIARGMRRLKRYLDKVFPEKKLPDVEKQMAIDALVRISNWCCQDLAECAPEGNYLKTLEGICSICRRFVEKRIKEDEEIRAARNENG